MWSVHVIVCSQESQCIQWSYSLVNMHRNEHCIYEKSVGRRQRQDNIFLNWATLMLKNSRNINKTTIKREKSIMKLYRTLVVQLNFNTTEGPNLLLLLNYITQMLFFEEMALWFPGYVFCGRSIASGV